MRLLRLARPAASPLATAVISLVLTALFAQRTSGQSLPNLVVDSIEVTPAQIVVGATLPTIKVTWRNSGSGGVPAQQRLCLWVEINPAPGTWSSETCYSSGAPAGYSTHKLFFPPAFTAQGGYFVSATIDSRSEVAESNDADNHRNYIVNVTPPDGNPPPPPTHLSPGNGDTTTDATPHLDWTSVTDPEGSGTKYDVQVSTSSSFSPLARSAADLTGSGWEVGPTLVPGSYYWRVRAKDYAGSAGTWTSPWSFRIPAPPSLEVTQPAADVAVPRGQPLTVVWNGTDPDSVASVSIGFDADQVFDNGNHVWIAIHQGEDGALSWDTSGVAKGDYYIFGMITDGTGTAHDYADGRVTVTDPVFPDLTGSIQAVVPRTVAPGGKVVATTVFRNQGADAAGPSHFRGYLSSNADPADFSGTAVAVWIGPERPVELQTSAVEGIPANTSWTPRHLGFQIPATLPDGGPFWIKVKADSEGAVAETDDQNNVAVAPLAITVKKPTFGTTVLVHGWSGLGSCPIDWMYPMAEAIRRRAGKGQILFYRPDPLDPSQGIWADSFDAGGNCGTSYSPADNDPTGETILLFDWIAESDRFANGWSEAAADALFAALIQGWRAGKFALAPLHFIGHSRGTVVNSETVERLLDRGLGVDHVTNLDPHWWGLGDVISDDWDVNARHPEYPEAPDEQRPAPVVAWAGVRSIDTYYQTDVYNLPHSCSLVLTGQRVPGGANLDLTTAVDGIEHCEVHAWYYFTIDPDPAVVTDGDEIGIGAGWFTSGTGSCSGARTSVYSRERDGYYFSRIGGADVPCQGALANRTSQRFGDGNAAPETFANGLRGDLDVAPESGWEEHGGEVLAIRPSGGVEPSYISLREKGEVRHNRQHVPVNAVGLRFEMKADANPTCSEAPDDVVRVSLGRLIDLPGNPGELGWTSHSSPACSLGWQDYFVAVPSGFRDRTTDGLRFDLVRRGTALDHELGIRSVEWVVDDAPAVVTKTETEVGATTATLNGWADPQGASATAWFEWGETPSYGATTSPLAALGPGAQDFAFTLTGLACNRVYHYRAVVESLQGRRYGAGEVLTSEACPAGTPPAAPSWLRVTPVSSSQIHLQWDDNSSTESGFGVERKEGCCGPWTSLPAVGANATTAESTGLNCNITYAYRVWAYNAAGNSATTNEANTTTPACQGTSVPVAPSALQVSGTATTQINLTWQDNSANETGFKVERKQGAAGSWTEVGAAGATTAVFQDTSLACATAYTYRARAYNSAGTSAPSNETTGTTSACVTAPAAPSWLRVTAVSPTQLHLQWDDNSSSEEGFRIERKMGCCGPWTPLPSASANATTYESTGLSCNTSYAYRVWAYNAAGESGKTNEAARSTLGCP